MFPKTTVFGIAMTHRTRSSKDNETEVTAPADIVVIIPYFQRDAGQLAESRRSFAASVPHLVRRRMPVDWARVRATCREDPSNEALFLPNVLRSVLRGRG